MHFLKKIALLGRINEKPVERNFNIEEYFTHFVHINIENCFKIS